MRKLSRENARKICFRRRKTNLRLFTAKENQSSNFRSRDRKYQWNLQSFLRTIRTDKRFRFWGRSKFFIALILGSILIVIVTISSYESQESATETLVPPDPEILLPPSWSSLKSFGKSVVCADSDPCAFIGKSILSKNGSAVDAAIATLICNGLVNVQSMGFGGGFIMVFYDRKTKSSHFLNARDCAPLKANISMFEKTPLTSSQKGALSITVPGELAGYWEAHRKFGKIPWKELFQPSIEICKKGVNMTKALYDDLLNNSDRIYEFEDLKAMFVDPESGHFWKPGTRLKPRKMFCKTLEIVAENGAGEFYNGTLARNMIEDIRKRGAILGVRDLNLYRARWEKPVESELLGNARLHVSGLPGSGPLLAFILNVLETYKFTSESIKDAESMALTYHRMLETFKFAYAFRTKLGDPTFADASMLEFLKNLTSKEFAKFVRSKISDERTYNDPLHYWASSIPEEDHGTSHVSVISPDGDAVAVTSTINIYFGCGLISKRTGVLFNSGMDDLGIPLRLSYFGIPPSSSNFIAPQKRALSSMSPTILTDSQSDVRMVIGAAGGTKITTALAFAISRYLWMGNSLKEAVDAPRIHHQLYPMMVSYEYGVLKQVIDRLQKMGHRTSRYRDRGSVICFVTKENGTIYANADYRKGGNVHGHD